LGGIEFWLLDYARMQRHYEEQVAIAREVGDRRLLSSALFNSSFEAVVTGDIAASLAVCQEALIAADPDDHLLLGQIWGSIGFGHLLNGDPGGAAEATQRSITLYRRAGERWALCGAMAAMAGISFVQGELADAAARLREAVDVAVALPTPQILATVILPEALLATKVERFERAALLLGAMSRFEDDFDIHFPEVGLRFFGAPEPPTRAALGDEAYERLFAEGRSLTQAEIVALVEDTARGDSVPTSRS